MFDLIRWALVVLLTVYFAGLMWGLGGMLALYGLEGRQGFYAAHASRTGVSVDRLEWVLVLAHLAWPLLWLRRDPQFIAARMGTLSRAAEEEYRREHPHWNPRRNNDPRENTRT